MSVHPSPIFARAYAPDEFDDDLGGAPLEGSGFEGQTPDLDFLSFSIEEMLHG